MNATLAKGILYRLDQMFEEYPHVQDHDRRLEGLSIENARRMFRRLDREFPEFKDYHTDLDIHGDFLALAGDLEAIRRRERGEGP